MRKSSIVGLLLLSSTMILASCNKGGGTPAASSSHATGLSTSAVTSEATSEATSAATSEATSEATSAEEETSHETGLITSAEEETSHETGLITSTEEETSHETGLSTEETSESGEKKYDVDSKFALIVDGSAYEMGYNETPLDPSFDEYFVLLVNVGADEHVWMYDSENDVEFNIAKVTGSTNFVVDGDDLVCSVPGTYNFYAKFKYGADELYIEDAGGEEESSHETGLSTEETSESGEKKYDVDSKYALIVDGTAHEMTHNEEPLDPSFDEYYVLTVYVVADAHVWMYDSENDTEFNFAVVTGSEKFVVDGDAIVCTANGTYDFFAKFKWQADELYIAEVPEI